MTSLRSLPLRGALVAAGALVALQSGAEPLRIHVRGSAQIDAVAWAEPDGFVVRGALIDDAGIPIAQAPLSIEPEGARGQLPQATPCAARSNADAYRQGADGYAVETDERGAFCLRGRAPLAGGPIRVRFQGSKLYEGALSEVPIEAAQAGLSAAVLRFDPAVDVVDLDRESFAVTATLRVDRSDPRRRSGASAVQREGLTLVLEDERGAKLAEAQTGGDARARFEVTSASLDAPGQGELRLRFDGSDTLAKATAGQPVVRRAQVLLALAHPLEAASGEDGASIDVDVTSSRGPVEGGVVEALQGGESVGTAAVQAGRARVIAALTSEREARVPVTLRYVPAAPWWRPGPELNVEVPLSGPGVWRQIVLGALVLGIAGWVIGGWRRAPKPPAAADAEAKAAPPSGRAGVHVVGLSEGATGWRGVVKDAHDGAPIAGAELTIIVPAFDDSGVVARATTDNTGAFAIDAAHRADARLVVHAATHSTYEQALPPPSTLAVALVTRRRALLDRLVRWARRQGAPFEGPPEPTPGHVRRVATRAQRREIEQWATRLEHAAFGAAPVDERVERDVRDAEPRPGQRG